MNRYRRFVIATVFGALTMISSSITYPAGARIDPRIIDSTTETSSTETVSVTESVSLAWTAPTTRVDGELLSLSEVEGYRVYYGTDKDNMVAIVDLNDSSTTSYTISGLGPGTYYFAVTAYDYDGLESSYSEIVSKQL